MEHTDQQKIMGMPNSIGYNPSQVHQKQSSSPAAKDLLRNQHNPSHQSVERDPNSDPNPLVPLRPQASTLVSDTTTTMTTSSSIRYRECLKNHAANIGGHVLDGCGEFMPTGEEGTPEALKCAACDCHRNFHRKETKVETHIPRLTGPYSTFPTMQTQQHHNYKKYFHYPVPAVVTNFRANKYNGAAESSIEDLVNLFDVGGQVIMQPSNVSLSKKRFRTKFRPEQKEKMHEFAEKLGWKIQKEDEQQLQQFCNEVRVKREVFKVWMHNSKQANKKRSQA